MYRIRKIEISCIILCVLSAIPTLITYLRFITDFWGYKLHSTLRVEEILRMQLNNDPQIALIGLVTGPLFVIFLLGAISLHALGKDLDDNTSMLLRRP